MPVCAGCKGVFVLVAPDSGLCVNCEAEFNRVNPAEQRDELTDLLAEGWEIAGYTVNMLVLGSQHYNILLRRGTELVNFGILMDRGKELRRGVTVLTPLVSADSKNGILG